MADGLRSHRIELVLPAMRPGRGGMMGGGAGGGDRARGDGGVEEADVVDGVQGEQPRRPLLATFAGVHSLALQQTIFEMGKAVLERYDEVAEISLSCPNKHHFLVDLEPFGLDNPGEVFFAADRPYGLIEATVQREED